MPLIERPKRKKYMITDLQIWEILCEADKQGGNRTCVARINKIMEQVTAERDM